MSRRLNVNDWADGTHFEEESRSLIGKRSRAMREEEEEAVANNSMVPRKKQKKEHTVSDAVHHYSYPQEEEVIVIEDDEVIIVEDDEVVIVEDDDNAEEETPEEEEELAYVIAEGERDDFLTMEYEGQRYMLVEGSQIVFGNHTFWRTVRRFGSTIALPVPEPSVTPALWSPSPLVQNAWTEEEIERQLPATNHASIKDKITGDPNVCSICPSQVFTGNDVRLLPCSHFFHTECIDQWLMEGANTCPNCREAVLDA